jgi:hypothetical protein
MSFGDISTSRNTNVNRGQNGFGDLTSSSDKDPLAQLRVSLANFQVRFPPQLILLTV